MIRSRHSLIRAIADLDIDGVEKYMDEDVLHFRGKKIEALKYLKLFFGWMIKQKGEGGIEVKEIKCEICHDENGNEVLNNKVILFRLINGSFAINLLPTKDGLFKLDYCGSYLQEDKKNEDMYIKYVIKIPFDLLPDFIPDALYLRLLSEKEKMFAEIENGQILFWFLEDLTAWLEKHAWAIKKFENYTLLSYGFGRSLEILHRMVWLQNGMMAEIECLEANYKFQQLNPDDLWESYEWIEKYDNKDFATISLQDLNLNHMDAGYFTFKEFLLNLRFSIYGHKEFLKFIRNLRLAHDITEELIKDTLFDDIEEEWYWEEWGKDRRTQFDSGSNED